MKIKIWNRLRKKAVLSFATLLYMIPFLAQHANVGTRPSPNGQLGVILASNEVVIPQVSLEDKALNKEELESVLIFNSRGNKEFPQGFYYWKERWNPLFENHPNIEYVLYWDMEMNLVNFINDRGELRKMAVGGLGNLKFQGLHPNGRSIEYTDEDGEVYQVDLGQMVKNNENVLTFIKKGEDRLYFINNNREQELVLSRESSEVEKLFKKPEEAETAVSERKNKEEVKEDKYREIESIQDNSDGTFTVFFTDGTRFTSRDLARPKKEEPENSLSNLLKEEKSILDVVNNNDGTFSVIFTDGTSLPSLDIAGLLGDPSDEEETRSVELVMDNGDGTYTFILSDGTEIASVDLFKPQEEKEPEEDGKGVLAIIPKEDGTYMVYFTDGSEMSSEDVDEDLKELQDRILNKSEEPVDDIDIVVGVEEEIEEEVAGEMIVEKDLEENLSEEILDELTEESSPDEVFELTENALEEDEGEDKEQVVSRGIKTIVHKGDGIYRIVLTDGVELESPKLASVKSLVIIGITDKGDGSFEISLADGTSFLSRDIRGRK